MSHATDEPSGYLQSLRSLGDGLLGALHERIQLFTVELQEEKFRLIQLFIWICAAVFTSVMVITFASLTLVYLFWDSARLAVLSGLTVLYAVALVVLITGLRRFLARQPKPFAETLQEFQNDRACLQRAS